MAKTLTEAKQKKIEDRQKHMKSVMDAADAMSEIKSKKIGFWAILKCEVNLSEAMLIMGGDQKNVDNTMDMLKNHDTDDGKQLLAIQAALAHECYMRLVYIGEIQMDKIWNFKKGDYADKVISHTFDYGFLGPKCYIFNNNQEWERVNQ